MFRTILILTTLIFTVLFSSPSYSEWKKIGENDIGDTFYVDFERIRKHGGYVYFWELGDYLKPTKQGHLSAKTYIQGDCKLFRFKVLSFSFHKEPMGRGTGDVQKPVKESQGWKYPSPNSVNEVILKSVCSRCPAPL